MTSDAPLSLSGKRVWVAGHKGMVGSALVRRLASEDCDLIGAGREELDLRRQSLVESWMANHKPDVVLLAAAKVGGIMANSTYPAQFIHDNLAVQTNIIEGARLSGVTKLVFLGSSCIYPRLSPQPIPEEALMSGALEPTNEWYALAKIAGLKMAAAYRKEYGCDFISAMPTNLYGPNDNFDLANSHVMPALMRKAHEAKLSGAAELIVWGSGAPRREFLHVDDCADAIVFLTKNYSEAEHVNVGSGSDITILELTELVAEIVGFKGKVRTDPSKPDGMPRKLLSNEKLTTMGWRPRISLREGIARTYDWFLKNIA